MVKWHPQDTEKSNTQCWSIIQQLTKTDTDPALIKLHPHGAKQTKIQYIFSSQNSVAAENKWYSQEPLVGGGESERWYLACACRF